MLEVSSAFIETYPGACIGMLALGNVANEESNAALNWKKGRVEEELRTRFAGQGRSYLQGIEPIQSYVAYYKRFKKTYHVQLQLESVVFKGKGIPRANGLVEAMFMAELKNQLLTAGHDLSAVQLPIVVGIAGGDEDYVTIAGRSQTLTPGDMMMADRAGITSSVLHGPDQRTRIELDTTRVLYVVYAPRGVERAAVAAHLDDITENVAVVAPKAIVEVQAVLP